MSTNTEKSNKPSGADYPVDAADRMNQEARLRRAAAAGASASKSPIPGLMLQPSPHLPPPQKTATAAAPVPESNLSLEMPANTADDQNEPRMTYDEVLAELRKISAWADLQRRITRWSLIVLAVFVPVAIGLFIFMQRGFQTQLETNISSHEPDWYDVERNVRLGDFDKAIATGEALILKMPQYPEAHQRLAKAYVAAGNLEKAKEHYAEAFRLFPSEENEKLLNAIEKRLSSGNNPSNGSSDDEEPGNP
jgi:tetratricopeptide (TPR) repeat protein